MTLKFEEKEVQRFVDIILASFVDKSVDKLMSVFTSKECVKEMHTLLKIKSDPVDEHRKYEKKALQECDALFTYFNNHVEDIAKSKFVKYSAKVENIGGVLGTGSFSIFIETPKHKLKVGFMEVVSIKNKLVWNGRGITYQLVDTFESLEKNEKDNINTGEFIGDYQDVTLKDKQSGYMEYASKHARVYESLTIKGDLDLNKPISNNIIQTIIVKKDLVVEGSIINKDGSSGISLSVAGKTKAENLIAGGSVISLNKAIIKEFTVGFYNDGILSINSLDSNILLTSDHHTEIEDSTRVRINIDYEDDAIFDKIYKNDVDLLAQYLYQEKTLKKAIEKDDGEYYIDFEQLNYIILSKNSILLKNRIIEFSEKILSV